ncbi:hypothetical protein H312_01572 [Anncaliia algerae PRA339]|uniref:Uncharacterized protein n=1 Tax=Anncaliia algerae PRA339 TaxID=1288291 RepID=A0A059F1I9_9MICR|nr:hypothetical protein H312_01572 [Anncaliia algerae PRA339]
MVFDALVQIFKSMRLYLIINESLIRNNFQEIYLELFLLLSFKIKLQNVLLVSLLIKKNPFYQ